MSEHDNKAEKEMALLKERYLSRAKPGESVEFLTCPNCDHLLARYFTEVSPQPVPPPKIED